MLMYGSPSSINERVKRHIHRARSTFICWHRDSLIQTYGEDIIPYVWELVIVLQGLLRECITLIKLERTARSGAAHGLYHPPSQSHRRKQENRNGFASGDD